jgi:hypothetical protein
MQHYTSLLGGASLSSVAVPHRVRSNAQSFVANRSSAFSTMHWAEARSSSRPDPARFTGAEAEPEARPVCFAGKKTLESTSYFSGMGR